MKVHIVDKQTKRIVKTFNELIEYDDVHKKVTGTNDNERIITQRLSPSQYVIIEHDPNIQPAEDEHFE